MLSSFFLSFNKYVSRFTWFKKIELGDPFRQAWKKRIKRKGGHCGKKRISLELTNGKDKHSGQKLERLEITSALFVPSTEEGILTKMLEEEEETLSADLGWGVKVVEKSGVPITQLLKLKFPMIEGCVNNRCLICEDDGVKCGVKNVIYLMKCLDCSERLPRAVNSIYIGETARPCRARAIEHFKNASDLKPESFIVKHWLRDHGTQMTQPRFEFKVIRTCSDALTRQVGEAVWILKSGNLNSKSEFGTNHLCRLVADLDPRTAEQENLLQEREKSREKTNMSEFSKVVRNVINLCNNSQGLNSSVSNELNTCRQKRSAGLTVAQRPAKKKKSMDSSTPIDSRRRRDNASSPPDEPSPITAGGPELSPAFILEGSDHLDHLQNTSQQPPQPLGSPTGTSLDLGKTRLSLTQVSETSLDRDIGANALMDVATRVGILYTGQPQELPARQEEHQVSRLVQALVDGLDFSQWSSDTSFGKVDSSADNSTYDQNTKTRQTDPQSISLKSGKKVEAMENGRNIFRTPTEVAEKEDGEKELLSKSPPKSLKNAPDTFPSQTPKPTNLTKRKLKFGQELTPEVGHQRAVPGACSSKRGLDLSPETSYTPKRRLSVGIYTDGSDRPKPNIIEALMGREKTRSQSSPATPHRRRKKQLISIDCKQRTIKTMWTKDKQEGKEDMNPNNLESTNTRSSGPKMTAAEKGDGSSGKESSK